MGCGKYMDLISCTSAQEVRDRVREWASNLTEHEHLVRSVILDIHADVEGLLKKTLYQILVSTIFHGDDEAEYAQHCRKLARMVMRLNFAMTHRLLKPACDAFPADELASIQDINELRNRVAHTGDMADVEYKGRNPFVDADCLAQVYLDAWAIRQQLVRFFNVMVEEPRRLAEYYAEYYQENH